MKQFLSSKKTKYLFVLGLVSFFSFLYILRSINPPKESSSSSSATTSPLKTPDAPAHRIEFDLSKVSLPGSATLKVYSLVDPTSSDSRLTQIGQTLFPKVPSQTVSDPVFGQTHLWSNSVAALSIKTISRLLTYSTLNQSEAVGFTVDQTRITSSVASFLSPINQSLTSKLTPTNITYLLAADEATPVTTDKPSEANSAQVDVTAYIDGLPVISGLIPSKAQSRVVVDTTGKVIFADLYLPPSNLTITSDVTTFSPTEAKAALPQARLINLSHPNPVIALESSFAGKLIVDSAYLAYYSYLNQTTLEPVIVLNVHGYTVKGLPASGVYVLLAYPQ